MHTQNPAKTKSKNQSGIMRLAIGIATTGLIKAETVSCIFQMCKKLKCEYDLYLKESCAIHRNREMLAEKAIRTKSTHLLFIDTDMWFESDAANRLIERDKDIVGTNANFREFPLKSTVRMSNEQRAKVEELKGFLTCDSVGMGFTLIKTEVFKNLPQPWFFWKSNDKGELVEGEDYWFCSLARKMGFRIWVDLTIPIKHIGDFYF